MVEIRGGFFENTPYRAEDFAICSEGSVTQGVVADVSGDTANALLVTEGTNMQVLVNAGYCWIKGSLGLFFGCASTQVALVVESADATYSRIDRVVVRKDSNNKVFVLGILVGTPSAQPAAVALTNNGTVDEICLAEITIPAGATEVTTAMISDKRQDTSLCGISQGAVNNIDTSEIFAQYEAQWEDFKGQLETDPAGHLQLEIGDLDDLTTTAKNNLVAAINELVTNAGKLEIQYGTVTTTLSEDTAITFETAFSGVPAVIVSQDTSVVPSTSGDFLVCGAYGATTQGCTVYSRGLSNTNVKKATTVAWVAVYKEE